MGKYFQKVFGHFYFPPCYNNQFDELDIDYRHVISLITADEIERDVNNFFACPPIKGAPHPSSLIIHERC